MDTGINKPVSSSSIGGRRRIVSRWRPQMAHLFVLPYVIFLIAFGIGPAIYAVVISFARFETGVPQLFSAGFSNYNTAYTDFRFAGAMGNMVRFLLFSLPFGVIGVLTLALMLHARPGRFSSTMRSLYFVPGAIAGPALALLAIFMFDPTVSAFGPLLHALGYNIATDLIRDVRLPYLFTFMGFFAGAGGWIAIFFGALNGISKEITEAAIIDGCNQWNIATRIKLPLIRPYIAYMLILVFAGNIQLFVEPQLVRPPSGVGFKYWSPNLLGYAFAFEIGNFGASAAISLLLLLIGLAGSILIIRFTGLFTIQAEEN